MGTFFKQIYRYSHPRAFRHNENLWPYVNITRSSTGEIVRLAYKKISSPGAIIRAKKRVFWRGSADRHWTVSKGHLF